MGSEWRVARLGDLVESCLGKMLDQNKNKGEPYPYLGNKSVRWGSFDLDDLALMPFEDHEHERYGLRYGDLIICEGGEPGRCAIWKDEVPNMKIQKALHRVRSKKDLNNVYLYYWFLWAGKNDRLHQYFTGTTIKHLTGKALSSVEITIPPLKIQNDIAEFLSSLDSKIHLNRQLNQTLEQMAQALFKSWFVDFDPVIDNALAAGNAIPEELQDRAERRQLQLAKADHKPLPENIRKLFPSEFELTESLGWVPLGWGAGTIADFCFVKAGYAYKGEDFTDEGWPVLKIKNITSSRTVDTEDVQFIPSVIAEKTKDFWLDDGDLLMAMTGATVGKFGLLTRSVDSPYLLNQRVAKFVPNNLSSSKPWFIYCHLSRQEIFDLIVNSASGSAQPNISAGEIGSTICICPRQELVELFSVQVDVFFKKILKNRKEANSLVGLRDTLLPKLISGELRIPEAQGLVEEVLG